MWRAVAKVSAVIGSRSVVLACRFSQARSWPGEITDRTLVHGSISSRASSL